MELNDLLELTEKQDIIELELGIRKISVDKLWNAICNQNGCNNNLKNGNNDNFNDKDYKSDQSPEPRLATTADINNTPILSSGRSGSSSKSSQCSVRVNPINTYNKSNRKNYKFGGIVGLKNFGNTCFMNSAIQVTFACTI